ncbi:PRTRC genetic system protein B [Chitinophaga terrae (ex Kim and Jung 2007)]|uniref:PRTRC system protein B n=1 Tax=Chitinophaga terrae (ex Kim and Jung 2007) TaxID=408074 RepID=UPI002785F3DC|nr:PRTRC system protein B [Chitinophaga terrae (ex Kim and Jung 2007)]MDQ0107486.1 PRTRC genetic system protein B [Chitinophaga terrae (ex Kim and Jung 2007)]
MKDVTSVFSQRYRPVKIIAIHADRSISDHNANVCAEAYDLDKLGRPINAHPLSVDEAHELAGILKLDSAIKDEALSSSCIIPANVLHIGMGMPRHVIWHTPAGCQSLFFTEDLGIPSGTATVPAMLWKATQKTLQVFALRSDQRPTINTSLYHAPFFNTAQDGMVCMGTVDKQIDEWCTLDEFIARWQGYFWNSYFSHANVSVSPIRDNIVQFWKKHINSGKPFPSKLLIKSSITINDLLQ